jgi:hypothetical protein
MENPVAKLFRSENLILILIFFFGYFIATYLLKSFGIYEGMTGGDSVSGTPIQVSEVYNY